MNRTEILGCGRFLPAAWADLLSARDPGPQGAGFEDPLAAHLQECGRCRAEWEAFRQTTAAVRAAVQAEHPRRDAFVDRVLMEARTAPPPRRRRFPALAGAAALALLAVLGAGLWPGGAPKPEGPGLRSAAEVLPGGPVVKALQEGAVVGARGLRADGTVSAASGPGDTGRIRTGGEDGVPGNTGKAIRVTLGGEAAASADDGGGRDPSR